MARRRSAAVAVGATLQTAAMQPYAELVEARVFAPAGMPDATMNAAAGGEFAYGHSQGLPPLGPLDHYYHLGYYGPMGGAWLSARDLAAFGRLLISNGAPLLQGASFQMMSTPVIRTGPPGGPEHGLGLFIDRSGDYATLGHSGSVAGFLTDVIAIPELGFAALAVSNGDAFWPGELTTAAIETFTDYQPGPYLAPMSSDHPDYVGTYEDPVMLGTIEVRMSASGGVEALFTRTMTTKPLDGVARDVYSFRADDGFDAFGVFWRDAPGRPAQYFVTDVGVARRAN